MKTSCPHCGQHLEGDDSLAGTSVECPGCGKTFDVPGVTEANPSAPPPLPDNPSENEGTLDEANRLLERLIGNVAHAILGIIRRVGTVLQWFLSAKFAKFLILLLILAVLLAALGCIAIAPYAAILWFFKAPPKEIPENEFFFTPPEWQWWFEPKDSLQTIAIIVEIVWMALFVAWGIWIGIRSYKRGAIARWRERRRARKAART